MVIGHGWAPAQDMPSIVIMTLQVSDAQRSALRSYKQTQDQMLKPIPSYQNNFNAYSVALLPSSF